MVDPKKSPGNNPQPSKADMFRDLLTDLSAKDKTQLEQQANKKKLDDLRSRIDSEQKRKEILDSAGGKLDALKQSIETAKANREFVDSLDTNAADFEALSQSVTDTIAAQQSNTATQVRDLLNFDLSNDVLPVAQQAALASAPGASGILKTIQPLLSQFKRISITLRRYLGSGKNEKALRAEEQELRLKEFSVLGTEGLREQFQLLAERGQYNLEFRPGARDQRVFDSLQTEFEKNPGVTMDVFLRRKFMQFTGKITFPTSGKKMETTLFGLLASKTQEIDKNRESLIGNNGERIAFSNDAKDQYDIAVQKNILSVSNAQEKKTHDFVVEGVLSKKDGKQGPKVQFEFIDGEMFTGDPKSITLVLEGSAYMGTVSHRNVIQLKGDVFEKAMNTLAQGDPEPLQNLIDGSIKMSGPASFFYPAMEIATNRA